jgi:hypothetical protein
MVKAATATARARRTPLAAASGPETFRLFFVWSTPDRHPESAIHAKANLNENDSH